MKEWEVIRNVVQAHEATVHKGTRCDCPNVLRAVRAAIAFQRQFGTSTKPGILPDEFDDKTGTWTTKTWMDADSTLLDERDFARLPKAKQQEKDRWIKEELEHGASVLESEMPGTPQRRSPRARKEAVVGDLMAGAVPTGDGRYTFAQSVRDAIGKDEVTPDDMDAFAVRKLEEDRRKQRKVEMGWSQTSPSGSARQRETSADSSSEASPPSTPDTPSSPAEPSTSSPAQT